MYVTLLEKKINKFEVGKNKMEGSQVMRSQFIFIDGF